MRIALASDLHLEHAPLNPEALVVENCGVLILAGDVCTLSTCDLDWWRALTDRYEKVFYVLGNHEYYGQVFQNTYEKYVKLLSPKVELMQRRGLIHNGVRFLGATLWSNFNNNPIDMWAIKQRLNDYKKIRMVDERGNYYKILPYFILDQFEQDQAWLRAELEQDTRIPTVVITHHAPSFESVAPQYRSDVVMNGAYASDLRWMEYYENIRCWVHGHMHTPCEYTSGYGPQILCNPRGYPSQSSPEYRAKVFTVKE